MICPNCGHNNKEDAKFCRKCGTSLNIDNPVKTNQEISKTDNSSKNLIIICVTVVICSMLIAGAIAFMNMNHNNDNGVAIESNNTNSNGQTNNQNSNTEDGKTESNPSTIDSDVYSYNVQGVDFNVPSAGHMRTSEALSFTYNGADCEVQKVPQYEASSYNHELSSVTFSKDYQNGEPYQLIVNNHSWIGVKVEKGGKWFHISMRTTNKDDAEVLLDWMSQHNTWNAP